MYILSKRSEYKLKISVINLKSIKNKNEEMFFFNDRKRIIIIFKSLNIYLKKSYFKFKISAAH